MGQDLNGTWSFDFDKADEAFYTQHEKYVTDLAKSGAFCGHCYVQLNDIENERNGYMLYDRTWKVDPARIAAIHARAAEVYGHHTRSGTNTTLPIVPRSTWA